MAKIVEKTFNQLYHHRSHFGSLYRGSVGLTPEPNIRAGFFGLRALSAKHSRFLFDPANDIRADYFSDIGTFDNSGDTL